MKFERRYQRNMSTISPHDNEKLAGFSVCVAGCGGLGGYVVELLGRMGIGKITAVDGDTFDETNLNRQLLAEEKLIGVSKAETAKKRMLNVNSEVFVLAVDQFITAENCLGIVEGHDLVIDALDNITARRILAEGCQSANIPLVHGAIAGWYGQVAVVLPGSGAMEKLYPVDLDTPKELAEKGVETELGNPSFTPAVVAAIEVAEAIKVLLRKQESLAGKLLTIDLLNHDYEVFVL